MPLLLIHFARFGPYHHARLRAAQEVLAPAGWEVVGLEIAGTDSTYGWDESKTVGDGPRVVTAFPGRVHEELTSGDFREVLPPLLDALMPDAMAIAGWASPDAATCLSWCRRNGVFRIVMSETRAADGRRVWWKELAKRYRISGFDGALVGGRSHRDYLVGLGMREERIFFGYNVIDDGFFEREAAKWREPGVDDQGGPQGRPYFLASNRFIGRKNLLRLIEGYHRYTETLAGGISPWALCLLGDGEQKPALIARCHELGLQTVEFAPWESDRITERPNPLNERSEGKDRSAVHFPGFRQIEELPRFYAHAGAFVHPALEEPWGLVLNEAMACRLPILSSRNVGAAEDLVIEGENGWRFDPGDVLGIAAALSRMASLEGERVRAMGEASFKLLKRRCSVSAFGRGLKEWLEHMP